MLVLAYCFPWYEDADWTSGKMSAVPVESCSGGDDRVIASHVQQADDHGVDGFICTWFGPKDMTTLGVRMSWWTRWGM